MDPKKTDMPTETVAPEAESVSGKNTSQEPGADAATETSMTTEELMKLADQLMEQYRDVLDRLA